MKERHATTDLETTNKDFLSNNHIIDIFLFITAIITGYKFGNILIMQTQETQNVGNQPCITASKRRGAVTQKEIMQKEINSECKIITYISLTLTILGLVMDAILHYKKSKWCKGHLFSKQ